MNRELVKQEMHSALREVYDPETGLNLVELGLIYGVDWAEESGEATVTMTFTTPACPAGDVMTEGVRRRMSMIPGVREVFVEVTFEPPWTPARITDEGKRQLGW